jgi:hypothetical protein
MTGIENLHREKEGIAFGGTLEDLDPGDLSPPTWMLSLERLDVIMDTLDVIHRTFLVILDGIYEALAHVGIFQAFGGPTFHLPAHCSILGAQRHLRGHDITP